MGRCHQRQERQIYCVWRRRALLSCGRDLVGTATIGLNGGWVQIVNGWYQVKAYGQTLYDWGRSHPVSMEIISSLGGG